MATMTSGRYMIGASRDVEARGHLAACGYYANLNEACVEAHVLASHRNPMGVWDSEAPRGEDWIVAQKVHDTHDPRFRGVRIP